MILQESLGSYYSERGHASWEPAVVTFQGGKTDSHVATRNSIVDWQFGIDLYLPIPTLWKFSCLGCERQLVGNCWGYVGPTRRIASHHLHRGIHASSQWSYNQCIFHRQVRFPVWLWINTYKYHFQGWTSINATNWGSTGDSTGFDPSPNYQVIKNVVYILHIYICIDIYIYMYDMICDI